MTWAANLYCAVRSCGFNGDSVRGIDVFLLFPFADIFLLLKSF